MIHSFLLIGQSNMAGRGFYEEVEPIDNGDGRLKVLRNGRWQPMYRPVNNDRPFAGVNLSESFVRAYANDHDGVEVGIIPCADGGTCLDQWQEGSLLFDHAVYMTRLAMRTSHLVGILWHQGEGDCHDHLYPLYLEKLTAIMTALRREICAENIPLIVGGLGDFLSDRKESPQLVNYLHINESLKCFATATPRTAYVSAEGLTANPDNLHFNAKSLHAFGLRYYEAFKEIEDKTRIFAEKAHMNDAIRTEFDTL